LYFGRSFPGAQVVALEPDEGNFAVCCKNVTHNRLNNVTVIKEALWKEDVPLVLDRGFRDGREWAFQVSPIRCDEALTCRPVDGVSLSTLFQRYDIGVVDLLKMDIEGAEKYLFEPRSDVAFWLPRVRVIAVEVHDNDGHELIVSLLQFHGFFAFQSGELTIGVNQRLTDQPELLEYFRSPAEAQVT
jgi:FkbM family methyltransferase